METQRQENAVALSPAKGIDVAQLEKELTAMWPGMTEGANGGSTQGIMRACVLNLIVYAPAREDRAKLDALLDEVYERNPSRALVLLADPDEKGERLDAYVSMRCSLSSKGAKQICGEQITIEAGGAAIAHAASAIEPLLVPDVPAFLWWKDIPHYDDKLFGRLIGICDRIVIDSAFFDHPHRDLLRLSEILSEHARLAVSDLNWGRLTPWRSLVAGFWDVADYRSLLEQIERVEIVYSRAEISSDEISPAALLTAGWLVSRLGWKYEAAVSASDDSQTTLGFRTHEGRELKIALKPSGDTTGFAGELHRLTITAGVTQFCVELKAGGNQLETVTRVGSDGHAVARLLSFERWSEGKQLGNELAIHTRDKVYEEAVAACAELLKPLGE